MTNQDRQFYREEKLQWTGPWNVPVAADTAADLVNRLLEAVGEDGVKVLVVPEADWHQAFVDRIEFIACLITPNVIIHEVAHVVQMRDQGWYGPDHDADLWLMMGILESVLMEIL